MVYIRPEKIAEEFRMYFEKLLNRDSTTEVDELDDTVHYTIESEVYSKQSRL